MKGLSAGLLPPPLPDSSGTLAPCPANADDPPASPLSPPPAEQLCSAANMESENKLAATTLDRRIAVVRYSAGAWPEQATLGRRPRIGTVLGQRRVPHGSDLPDLVLI